MLMFRPQHHGITDQYRSAIKFTLDPPHPASVPKACKRIVISSCVFISASEAGSAKRATTSSCRSIGWQNISAGSCQSDKSVETN
jgi:hypothetical protein